jgi:putative ABC transport system substrate-binding protein
MPWHIAVVALAPDVILAASSQNVAALRQTATIVPIVFAKIVDPVGAGFVARLARPGGNTTGFTAFEYSLSGKWFELFREIAPNLTRIAILRDPATAAGIGQFAVIQAMAFGVELSDRRA